MQLCASDDPEPVELEERALACCATLGGLVDDLGKLPSELLRLPVQRAGLLLVKQWFEATGGRAPLRKGGVNQMAEVDPWLRNNLSLAQQFQLLDTASYLGINQLIEPLTRALTDWIASKSADEIRQQCGLERDELDLSIEGDFWTTVETLKVALQS